jgi:adenosine deaminase
MSRPATVSPAAAEVSPAAEADLAALPKAHLHLHLTGGMRRATVRELAAEHGISLPERLVDEARDDWRLLGWARFQRLYDLARQVLRRPEDIRRLVREIAEDERAAGSRWLELQVTPTGYVPRLGDVVTVTELLLAACAEATSATGVDVRLIIAANRTRPPWEAELLARLATRLSPYGIVGFGLSNDERIGSVADYEKAFRIARDGGLIATPHAGELLGATAVARTIDLLAPRRIGHGVRAAEDPAVLSRLADLEIACEVCPASNVALGVVAAHADLPLTQLLDAGVPVVLAADDPMLFKSGLLDQYAVARDIHGLSRTALAGLARASIENSTMARESQRTVLAEITAWEAHPETVTRRERSAESPGSSTGATQRAHP